SIDYLRALPVFSHVSGGFWDYLAAFRFSGDVHAIPEGTVVFAGEPLVRVRAPVIEGQLVETFLLATVNHQTLIATKAARVVEAAAGTGVIEFGARRAPGFAVRGVRLDGGDLLALSRAVREILDAAGLARTLIVASGDLNEERITALAAAGAPIDLYGVGTDLATSRDAPALGGVYKLA